MQVHTNVHAMHIRYNQSIPYVCVWSYYNTIVPPSELPGKGAADKEYDNLLYYHFKLS